MLPLWAVRPGSPQWAHQHGWLAHDGGMVCRRLGGVGAAHPAAPFGGPLLLIQAAPGAVLFWPGNGISEAFRAHGTRGANRLRLAFPHLTLGLTLSVRPEEEHDVLASARAGVLPGPARPWRHGHLPTYLRHESVSSNFRVFPQPSKRRVGRTRGRTSSAFTPSIHPTHYAALVFPHIRIPRSAARARKFRGQSRRRTGGGVTRLPSRRSQPVQPNRRSIVPSAMTVPQAGERIRQAQLRAQGYWLPINDH